MTDLTKTRNEPIEQLFDILDDTHAVMIGLDRTGDGMQPMAPQVDEEKRGIWFFAKRDSDMGGTVVRHPASRANISLVGPDHNYHAYITGTMSEEPETARIEEFWSPVVAAWFEGGKDDPNLILMRFDPAEADIWASSGSVIRFAWEIAMANMSGDEPSLGETARVVFPGAAPHTQAVK
ncbi:pyridoxamine 5'-phosphate oxidase family protein [Hoeflea sp. YIM 152468]|uniref:pyridoxamine 5'-phosphate oxidase family protein n=1 Tax=Hoeflea sp. YIM 152468 TaxID=3031759 RepID=UPI0023DA2EC3|nr:pyridoxamine 5'-phosphate oxidase family protein [Hoeflea sp. YIM 152468]MDF1606920.1 pyridoxamine 5'-phosphate oxidase family protein [Hoeflea sp. YIM 152468]